MYNQEYWYDMVHYRLWYLFSHTFLPLLLFSISPNCTLYIDLSLSYSNYFTSGISFFHFLYKILDDLYPSQPQFIWSIFCDFLGGGYISLYNSILCLFYHFKYYMFVFTFLFVFLLCAQLDCKYQKLKLILPYSLHSKSPV